MTSSKFDISATANLIFKNRMDSDSLGSNLKDCCEVLDLKIDQQQVIGVKSIAFAVAVVVVVDDKNDLKMCFLSPIETKKSSFQQDSMS